MLGAFLFTGDDVDKKVGVLSGGEKARLALAKMLVRPASLLLSTSRRTTSICGPARSSKRRSKPTTGTIVFISHDRYFINRIATSVCEVKDGKLDLRPGSYDDYAERLREAAAAAAAEARGGGGGAPAGPARRRAAARRAPRGPERRRAGESRGRIQAPGGVGPRPASRSGPKRRTGSAGTSSRRGRRSASHAIEQEIAGLESRIREVEAALADPATYRDGEKARRLKPRAQGGPGAGRLALRRVGGACRTPCPSPDGPGYRP